MLKNRMGHPKVGAGGGGEAGSTHLWVCPRDQLDGGNAGAVGGSSVLAAGSSSSSLLVSEDPVFLTKATIVKFLTWNSAWFFASASLHSCAPPHAGGSWLPAAVP